MDGTGVANLVGANILVQLDGKNFLIGGLSRIALEAGALQSGGGTFPPRSSPPIVVRSLASSESDIDVLETQRAGDPIQEFIIFKPTKLDLDAQGRPIPGSDRISEIRFKDCSLEHTQRFSFDPNQDPATTYGELVVNCPPFNRNGALQPDLDTLPPGDTAPKDAGTFVSAFDVTVEAQLFRARMVEGGQIIATATGGGGPGGTPRLEVQPVVIREIGTKDASRDLMRLLGMNKPREMNIELVVGSKKVPGPRYRETFISRLTLFNPARGANDFSIMNVDAVFGIACSPDIDPTCIK